jgi:hypothetical protein
MAHVDVGAGPDSRDFSLSDLQEWVRGIEALLGPIVQIGHDEDETGGTFDQNNPDNPPSEIESKVRISLDGNAPPNATKLADGWAFVSGSIQHVVVYREAHGAGDGQDG